MSLQDLKDDLYRAVMELVPERDVAVAFSGGVDSSILAKICYDLGKVVALVTIGFPRSHDVEFSKKIALKFGMTHVVVELDEQDFRKDLDDVMKKIDCSNTSHIENCIAYFYIARTVQLKGISILLSANGCDELFCGYNSYRAVYDEGEEAVMNLMNKKIENELALVREIGLVASDFGVQVKQPFLSAGFVKFAKTIPLDQKMRGSNDLLRKRILREVALLIGVPEESATKPKKALQYGSLIDKYYKKYGHSS